MTTEKTPDLKVGQRVSITSGPREGREGEIMGYKGSSFTTKDKEGNETIANTYNYHVAIDGRSLEWIEQSFLSLPTKK